MRAWVMGSLLAVAACGETEGGAEDGPWACVWQERHGPCGELPTAEPFETKCIDIEWDGAPAYTTRCQVLVADDIECGGSCCLYYEYQAVQFLDGQSCADAGYTPL